MCGSTSRGWSNTAGSTSADKHRRTKMLVGAASGKTLDDSIEGRLDVQATV